MGTDGASAVSSSAFLYLHDITDVVPRVFVVAAVFLVGVTFSAMLRLATKAEPLR
jgi:hypothetical protein